LVAVRRRRARSGWRPGPTPLRTSRRSGRPARRRSHGRGVTVSARLPRRSRTDRLENQALCQLLRRAVGRMRRRRRGNSMMARANTRDVGDTATIEAGVTGAGGMDAQGAAVPVTAGRTLGSWGRRRHMRRHAHRRHCRCAGQRQTTAAKKASNRQGDGRPASYLGYVISHSLTLRCRTRPRRPDQCGPSRA
jgi:hypothetical protein